MWQWLARRRGKADPKPKRTSSLPSSGQQTNADSKQLRQDLENLEGFLFAWLLNLPGKLPEPPADRLDALGKQLASRLNLRRLQSLPRQTGVLPQLMRAVANPNVTRQDIATIVLDDPSLTEQLLHVANSPYFKPDDRHIESVDHAIFLLGMEGIRNVISAAVMRPMMAARSNAEARFAQRSWHWGISCARASELIAHSGGQDPNGFFICGLMPSLAYLTLYREIMAMASESGTGNPADIRGLLYPLIREHAWHLCLQIADAWELPPRYHAILLEAQRPSPVSPHTPLNDGIILATREVLRHSHQRNLSEDSLKALLRISDEQFETVRGQLLEMLTG